MTPGEVSNLLWALFGRANDDGYGARVYAEMTPTPPIAWLQTIERYETSLAERHRKQLAHAEAAREATPVQPDQPLRLLTVTSGHNNPRLTEAAFHLGRWLVRHLDKDTLVDWVSGHARSGRRLHPRLRELIRQTLADGHVVLLQSQRRFWRIISSEGTWTEQGSDPDYVWDLLALLNDGGSKEIATAELLALLRPFVRLSPSNWRLGWAKLMDVTDADETTVLEDRFSRVAEAEVDLNGGNRLSIVLESFNKRPDANVRLADLADDLTSLLKTSLDLWAMVGDAGPDSDPSQYHQPSIKPHPQNRGYHHWTVLIDLLWRAWTTIDDQGPCAASRHLVDRWRSIRYPTFQRMALQAIGHSGCWSIEEKLGALLDGV